MPRNYVGQRLNAPIMVSDGQIYTDPQIRIARQPFYLERYDFDKIIKGESSWLLVGQMCLGAGIGLFLNMLGKLIGSKINPKITFDEWEIYAFVASGILTIICYVINLAVPNEKRRIVKLIKEHFENS